MPFFSITIPVYNVEKYIKQCLDSVLSQTFSDFEVIILDDGSVDNSGNICDEYAKKDSRIKVIHDTNQGSFMARQRALQYVTGEYVLFLDSDDYWETNLLESVYDRILEWPADMFFFRYKAVDENGKVLFYQRQLLEDRKRIKEASKFLCYQLATSFEYNSMVLKVIKREAIDMKSDYSDIQTIGMGDDAAWSAKMLKNIHSFVYLDALLYNYRVDISSQTTRVTAKYKDDYIKVRTAIDQCFKEYYQQDTPQYLHKVEFDIRGFVGLLADSADSNLIDDTEWEKIRNDVEKSEIFQNAYDIRSKLPFLSQIYISFLLVDKVWLWKLLGKIKKILRFLYNKRNRF